MRFHNNSGDRNEQRKTYTGVGPETKMQNEISASSVTGKKTVSARALRAGVLALAALIWAGTITVGFGALWRYKTTPGAPGAPPERWPASSAIERTRRGATIVMFAHPKCPCTRASLTELSLAMSRARDVGRSRAYVLFIKPSDTPENWASTDTWRTAARIPSTTVLLDRDGVEARRFGSRTSGDTLVYDADGMLLFAGGITFARGHEGDNAGEDALVSILRSGHSRIRLTSVFGCGLAAPKDGTATAGGRS